jgi:hypothetical protein
MPVPSKLAIEIDKSFPLKVSIYTFKGLVAVAVLQVSGTAAGVDADVDAGAGAGADAGASVVAAFASFWMVVTGTLTSWWMVVAGTLTSWWMVVAGTLTSWWMVVAGTLPLRSLLPANATSNISWYLPCCDIIHGGNKAKRHLSKRHCIGSYLRVGFNPNNAVKSNNIIKCNTLTMNSVTTLMTPHNAVNSNNILEFLKWRKTEHRTEAH